MAQINTDDRNNRPLSNLLDSNYLQALADVAFGESNVPRSIEARFRNLRLALSDSDYVHCLETPFIIHDRMTVAQPRTERAYIDQLKARFNFCVHFIQRAEKLIASRIKPPENDKECQEAAKAFIPAAYVPLVKFQRIAEGVSSKYAVAVIEHPERPHIVFGILPDGQALQFKISGDIEWRSFNDHIMPLDPVIYPDFKMAARRAGYLILE